MGLLSSKERWKMDHFLPKHTHLYVMNTDEEKIFDENKAR